jgi:hypothetical protein
MTPQLVCPGTNLSTSGGTFGFMVASANASMVLDVSRPQRTVFADGAVTLKGRVISCDTQNAKALKGKHFRVSHLQCYLSNTSSINNVYLKNVNWLFFFAIFMLKFKKIQ